MSSPLLAPFAFVAGHVIAAIDGRRVLIDTGSPATFGRGERLRLPGSVHAISPGILGFTVESAAEQIRKLPGVASDFDVDVLLGTDLLWGNELLLDFSSRTLRITPATTRDGAAGCSTRTRFLIEDLVVGGFRAPALLDTGAPVSYLAARHTAGLPVSGWARDFFHGGGDHQVPLRVVPALFRGREFSVAFAEPPVSVWMAMRLLAVQAIVGTDLLEQAGVVSLEMFG